MPAASRGYQQADLAYIHDAGFRDYALGAAPELLRLLHAHGIHEGLVVDLGSGSGRWARELTSAGYEALGIEQSAPMIELARKVAPRARFIRSSLFEVKLPSCAAITSMGECLNYTIAGGDLPRLFRRVYQALRPGGVFVFDFATPARLPQHGPRVAWREGRDWAISSITTDVHGTLRRHMTWFRRVGRLYRRGEETHDLRLYDPREVAAALRAGGFSARRLSRRGHFPDVPGMAWMLAVKR